MSRAEASAKDRRVQRLPKRGGVNMSLVDNHEKTRTPMPSSQG
nr:hypothetical protein [Bradyrhizobium diazoefficiens]